MKKTLGIHHITSIVGHPQENVDFYAGVLGLRLVKKTVNFDDPQTYHLYFGNKDAAPGTIITFFPWANAQKGQIGSGQVGVTTYAIPPNSLDYWEKRLTEKAIVYKKATRFNEDVLQFDDVHGLKLELAERDLLPLADEINPNANVLSVLGNVNENGMARYFKRLAAGVFDEEDLKFRTKELNEYINEAANEYGFNRDKVVAVGYSNGANIAGSLLFHYKEALAGAILHHPMVPLRGLDLPDLKGIPVFIGAGTNDPICPSEESTELETLLTDAGADVSLHWENYGHQLSASEVQAASTWYTAQKNA